MITVYGEGRGFRVIWLMEEMGLPYRLRSVDLLAGAESDPEFRRVNPGGFIPAIIDGDTTVVESIAPHMAGDTFTAADISVTYTLNLAIRRGGIVLDEIEKAYMARVTARDAYKRTLDACPAAKGFYASVPPVER